MRYLFVALTAPLLCVGGAALAQHRPTQDEIACTLANDCPGQVAPVRAAADDGSVVIDDEERPFCFGGSGCGHAAAKPAVIAQRLVAPQRPTPTGGNGRGLHGGAHPVHYTPAPKPVQAGRAAIDMALTFPNGSAELDLAAREQIAAFAQALVTKPSLTGLSFAIEGHTNAVGTRANNLDLSRRRAQAVVDYMVTLKVARERLVPQGLGFDAPIPGSKPADGANRRVEIVRK